MEQIPTLLYIDSNLVIRGKIQRPNKNKLCIKTKKKQNKTKEEEPVHKRSMLL